MRGDQLVARSSYVHSVRHHVFENKESLLIETENDPREEMSRPQQVEGLNKIEVDILEKVVRIGAVLPEEQAEALALLLIEFKELLTWKSSDIP